MGSPSISRAASRRASSWICPARCWSCPAQDDFLAADGTDTRNYGVLQGLPELRALLAPLFGTVPAQMVIGDNSSLALMHDAIVYALLKGTVGSERPWVRESRVAFLCPVPGYDRHFAICQDFGIEMIPVPLNADGPDMDVVERLVAEDAAHQGHVVRAEVQQSVRGGVLASGGRAAGRDDRPRRRTSGSSGTTPTPCTTSPTSASRSRA